MALLGSAGLTAVSSVATAAETDTTLVSRADGMSGAKQNGGVGFTDISGGGRFVAFASSATNLDAADTDTTFDIYVRDRQTNDTILVSRATGVSGDKSNGTSSEASISDDGRYVAFKSAATNLDAADTDGVNDIYVRDLTSNTTTLVSRATGLTGAVASNPNVLFSGSEFPSISGDGQHVSFTTEASNFDPTDNETGTHDPRRVRAEHRWPGDGAGQQGGWREDGGGGRRVDPAPPSPSDGQYVAFDSGSTNLDPDQAELRRPRSSSVTLMAQHDHLGQPG